MNPIIYDLTVEFSEFTGERKTRYTDLPATVNPIPTDTIIYKSVTGLGATYSELEAPRNSIIVLPHISIIKNKQIQHESLHNSFAVYNTVNVSQIIGYLKENHGHYKFLTTPRGMKKIKDALEEVKKDIYSDFFLLLDECHKIIRDAKYRDDMIPPMEDFFKFNHKAMVSATPIPPTDPRFTIHGFSNIKLMPAFEYKQPLHVIHSNGIVNALKEIIQDNPTENFYIFFNSIEGIKSVINNLAITAESSLFCSQENAIILKENVSFPINSEFHLAESKKFNFFTSSFYNGLDILVDKKPILVILTDVGYADFTIVDPYTDILQILGRLRNGYKQAIHINNAAKWTNPISEEEALRRVELSKSAYQAINALNKAYTGDTDSNFLGQLLERMNPFYNLLEDGEFSYFRLDNYLMEERIRRYYQSSRALRKAYISSNLYLIEESKKDFEKIDVEILSRGRKKYSRSNVEKVVDQLYALEGIYGTQEYDTYVQEIQKTFPLVTEAYFQLGPETIRTLKHNMKEITKALIKLDTKNKKNSTAFIEFLYLKFKLNIPYLVRDIKPAIQSIYDELNIKGTAVATDIEEYFYFKPYNKSIDGKSNRGYILTDYKFNTLERYKRA